jgi:hypothetical protein
MPAGFTYCSDYLHLFPLRPAANAIWLVLLDVIILIITGRAMAYASSIYINLGSLRAKSLYSLNSFPSTITIHLSV